MQHRYQICAAMAPPALTVMTISNSPHPCSVTSYGGCESSLVGFWKLECSWNTTYMMHHDSTSSQCIVKFMEHHAMLTLLKMCERSSLSRLRR